TVPDTGSQWFCRSVHMENCSTVTVTSPDVCCARPLVCWYKPLRVYGCHRRRSTMAENLSTLLRSTEPTVLTTGWGRTEGPLWHAEGSVTFVDLAGSRLLRWDPNGQVTVVREQTGEGNGCTLDRQGRLLMCEGADHRRITRMDAAGTVTAIAERWQGK